MVISNDDILFQGWIFVVVAPEIACNLLPDLIEEGFISTSSMHLDTVHFLFWDFKDLDGDFNFLIYGLFI